MQHLATTCRFAQQAPLFAYKTLHFTTWQNILDVNSTILISKLHAQGDEIEIALLPGKKLVSKEHVLLILGFACYSDSVPVFATFLDSKAQRSTKLQFVGFSLLELRLAQATRQEAEPFLLQPFAQAWNANKEIQLLQQALAFYDITYYNASKQYATMEAHLSDLIQRCQQTQANVLQKLERTIPNLCKEMLKQVAPIKMQPALKPYHDQLLIWSQQVLKQCQDALLVPILKMHHFLQASAPQLGAISKVMQLALQQSAMSALAVLYHVQDKALDAMQGNCTPDQAVQRRHINLKIAAWQKKLELVKAGAV